MRLLVTSVHRTKCVITSGLSGKITKASPIQTYFVRESRGHTEANIEPG